ncbi:hypothetical protein OAS86_02305 [Gammaproteobacteria bacterium]|nr:hypothetical protein [Gammaproteobacteria bacterium]
MDFYSPNSRVICRRLSLALTCLFGFAVGANGNTIIDESGLRNGTASGSVDIRGNRTTNILAVNSTFPDGSIDRVFNIAPDGTMFVRLDKQEFATRFVLQDAVSGALATSGPLVNVDDSLLNLQQHDGNEQLFVTQPLNQQGEPFGYLSSVSDDALWETARRYMIRDDDDSLSSFIQNHVLRETYQGGINFLDPDGTPTVDFTTMYDGISGDAQPEISLLAQSSNGRKGFISESAMVKLVRDYSQLNGLTVIQGQVGDQMRQNGDSAAKLSLSEVIDTHQTAFNGVFTAPVDGLYSFSVGATVVANTDNNSYQLELHYDGNGGSKIYDVYRRENIPASKEYGSAATVQFDMREGDTMSAYVSVCNSCTARYIFRDKFFNVTQQRLVNF